MKNAIAHPDFLLDTEAARTLYHGWAEKAPIIDYHCHIDPREIFEDRRFDNIAQIWLGGDHYKWRLMRSNGVEERYITGDAPDREKFQKFAESLPRAIGNPMYHWCHLELKNYFGYTGVLNGNTAEEVWWLCNEKLQNDPAMSARGLILGSNVAMVGTTDDPCSDLRWHEKLAADGGFPVRVCPSFRPDPAVNLHKAGFAAYIKKLEQVTGRSIATVEDVRAALSERIEYFDAHGCRSADHGLDYVMFRPVSDEAATAALQRALARGQLTREEAKRHPNKPFITRALGADPDLMADCFRQPMAPGDYLLLCSDGLSNVVSEQEILYEVVHGGEACTCCRRLLDIALHRGAPDNVTAVLVQC